jgi:ADP-L-glycero-D-manno-heptose 6-epimerase
MRDFVYVADCVDVMAWLREHPEVEGLFNLGTGRAQTWLELMGALYDAMGEELRVEWVDTPESLRARYQYFTEADMTKLRNAGYDRPLRPVEAGVRHDVETYLDTPDPYR